MNIQVKCEPQKKKFDKAQQHKSDVTGYSNVAGKLLTFTNECSTLGARSLPDFDSPKPF